MTAELTQEFFPDAPLLSPGPDDVWVLFMEAAFAMMAAGKDTIDYDCYAALNGGFPHHGIMGLTGESFGNLQLETPKTVWVKARRASPCSLRGLKAIFQDVGRRALPVSHVVVAEVHVALQHATQCVR